MKGVSQNYREVSYITTCIQKSSGVVRENLPSPGLGLTTYRNVLLLQW